MNRRNMIKTAVAASVAAALPPAGKVLNKGIKAPTVWEFGHPMFNNVKDWAGKVFRVDAIGEDPETGKYHKIRLDYWKSASPIFVETPSMQLWSYRVWVDGRKAANLAEVQKCEKFKLVSGETHLLDISQLTAYVRFVPNAAWDQTSVLKHLQNIWDSGGSAVLVIGVVGDSNTEMQINLLNNGSDEKVMQFASEVATMLKTKRCLLG